MHSKEEHPEQEELYKPRIEMYSKLYTPADLMRVRIVTLSFSLIGILILVGIAAVVWLSLAGQSTEPVVDFLKPFVAPLLAIATFAAGYLFGTSRSKGGSEPPN